MRMTELQVGQAAVDALVMASVQVSTTAVGAVNLATHRRALIAGILAGLPARQQHAVAGAMRVFAAASGEIPKGQRPAAVAGASATTAPEPAHAGNG
jgi:hypothetical protein